jgi:hypothetical protein
MEQVHNSSGYQVVARSWPLAGGRVVSFNPLPGAPNNQTRHQAKKFAAMLLRSYGAEWMHERGVAVQAWRLF